MSPVVVLIGYILLIPSLLGVLLSLLLLVLFGSAATSVAATAEDEVRRELRGDGVPTGIIDKAIAGTPLTAAERSSLDQNQRVEVDQARSTISARKAGAGAGGVMGGGFAVCFGISCFVGGLLGWLLVMRKKVLQCRNCGAVVAAS